MVLQINLILAIFLNSVTETIEVPLDHSDPNSRTISISYHLMNEFDPSKETLFTLRDRLDENVQRLDYIADFGKEVNWVNISGRYYSEDLQAFIESHAKGDWDKIYRWLNQNQVANDIELIRKKLLGDQKVMILGYSSSASLVLHYLSSHKENVSKLICINPLLFDIEENLSLWDFSSSFQE